MYMHVAQGFEKYYSRNMVLMILKSIYGTKQADVQFWKELVEWMKNIHYEGNKADPYIYFKWKAT